MTEFEELIEVIRRLRAPDGCPWDKQQDHDTLKPYLIEETYEVLDAIDGKDPAVLQDELGDLLLQIVLHAQIASEQKQFDLKAVAKNISEKMIRRHPHVFGEVKADSVSEVWKNWEHIKKQEKKTQQSILDSVPDALPALFRASKVQKKAARVGFDWPNEKGVLEKIKEEVSEFEHVQALKEDKPRQIEEFGDILFSLVNLARKLDIDAEDALRLSTKKFEKRFRHIEKRAAEQKKELRDYPLEELDKFWEEAKRG